MKIDYRNLLLLFLISFLLLTFYTGFFNYLFFYYRNGTNNLPVHDPGVTVIISHPPPKASIDMLLMGFKNSGAMQNWGFVALLFSFAGERYLSSIKRKTAYFKKACLLTAILVSLFLIYRIVSITIGGYFAGNFNRVVISAIVLFPLTFIFVLPFTFLLKNMYRKTNHHAQQRL